MSSRKLMLSLILLSICFAVLAIDRHGSIPSTNLGVNNIQHVKSNNRDLYNQHQYHSNDQQGAGKHIQHGGRRLKGGQTAKQNLAAKGISKEEHENHTHNDKGAFVSTYHDKSKKTANKSSHGKRGHNISASKVKGFKSGHSNRSQMKKQHKNNYVLSDNIHYGFDKKFNQEEKEDGIYKLNKHADAHKLTDNNYRHGDIKIRRGNSAAATSEIGSQRGVRESSENAFSRNNFMKMGDSLNNKNQRHHQDLHSNVFGSNLDYNAGGQRFFNKKGDSLGSSSSLFNVRTNNQNIGAARVGQRQQGGSHVVAGVTRGKQYGVAGKHSHNLLAAQASVAAKESRIGSGKSLANQNKNFQSRSKNGFSKSNTQRDDRNGSSRGSESHSDGTKSSRNKQEAAKHKTASDRQFADASKYSKHKDSAKSEYEKFQRKNNSSKRLENKVKNKKVSKLFHTSKKVKGDNYERLDFNRKKFEKDRAKDAIFNTSSGSNYDTKFRKTANKGNHYADSSAKANQISGLNGVTKREFSLDNQKKRNAGKGQYGAHRNGQFTFDNFGQGFNEFGINSIDKRKGNYKRKQSRGAFNTDFGQNEKIHVRNQPIVAARTPPKDSHFTNHHYQDSQRFQPSVPFDFGFDHSNFGIPSQGLGNSFSTFHSPFYSPTHRKFGQTSRSVLPKTNKLNRVLHTSEIRNPNHHASHDDVSDYHHARKATQPTKLETYYPGQPEEPEHKFFGGFESMSLSNVFSGRLFGNENTFPTFGTFRR